MSDKIILYLEDVAEEMNMINDESSVFYNTEMREFVYYSEYYTEDIDPEEFEDNKYISLPRQHDLNEYDLMEEFADSIHDSRKRELLFVALEGRGSFRRFKDTLDCVNMSEEWYKFKAQTFMKIAREWCEENDIVYELKNPVANG